MFALAALAVAPSEAAIRTASNLNALPTGVIKKHDPWENYYRAHYPYYGVQEHHKANGYQKATLKAAIKSVSKAAINAKAKAWGHKESDPWDYYYRAHYQQYNGNKKPNLAAIKTASKLKAKAAKNTKADPWEYYYKAHPKYYGAQ